MSRKLNELFNVLNKPIRSFATRNEVRDGLIKDYENAINRAFGEAELSNPAVEMSKNGLREAEFIQAILALSQIEQRLSNFEHYFRVYPFRRKQVAQADHLLNMIEAYLNIVYTYEERLKQAINVLHNVSGKKDSFGGKLIRVCHSIFKNALAARAETVHGQGYKDDSVRDIAYWSVLAEKDECFKLMHQKRWKEVRQKWARLAKRNAAYFHAISDAYATQAMAQVNFANFTLR